MNQSIFDLVTSANIAAYWLEKNINSQPMLGETLFPTVKEIGIKLDWIKGSKNQPVALRLSAYDSKAIRRDREGIEQYTTTMPFFKESMYIDEDMRQKLNTLLATNNTALINSLIAKIFDDQIKLIAAARISLERMRMELLQSGTITLVSNGQAYDYDFGVDHKETASTDTADAKAWSDPNADIVAQINEIKDTMKAEGVEITRAICNSSVIKYFKKNNNIKNSIYVLAGGSISSISSARALSYVQEETGIVFYAYDNVYVDEAGDAHKYIADDTVTFLPDGVLGNTHLGTSPEESDLMSGATDANVNIVDTGIAITTYKTVDPVNVEMKVSMVGMPSFERANEIVILDVK